MIRIGAANCGSTIRKKTNIDFRLPIGKALEKVDQNISELESIVHDAGKQGCDVVILPEDALATSAWENGNRDALSEFLPEAVQRMFDRLGSAAAKHRMYLIACNDTWESGVCRNLSWFLDRDGNEIGRYTKVCLPVQESLKQPGDGFPVFPTDDLGNVGMLICYDMVFPEPMRCLALHGADIVFNPTVGGAAFGGAEISKAAFRTRAVENFTYIAVSWGGWGTDVGSIILSPKGEVLAEEKQAGKIAVADIDPFAGRQNADWSNAQDDMRARLFRERRPEAFGAITDPNPPALDRLPNIGSPTEIAEIYMKATTVGHIEWEAAEKLREEGRSGEAISAYRDMQKKYPATWFDRTAEERLTQLRQQLMQQQ